MKHVQLMGLLACAAFIVGCESTDTAGTRNQELKRLAAIEQQRHDEEIDEGQRNLWNAQHDILTRDGNPANHYY